MNVLILGINYAPEMVGIGPYTAGMAQFLARAGHAVTVVCAKPYYPQWKVDPAFASGGRRVSEEHGVRVVRVPVYVPSQPNGTRRLAHHMSFAARAETAMIAETRRSKPDVVIGIAPSLISTIAARDAARRTGAKLWLHIQDFEVEAAFATGLLRDKGIFANAARKFEVWAVNADRVSTISPQMCLKLVEKGIPRDRVTEFRNWANIDEVVPLDTPSPFRAEWGIDRPHVAVYSGNIANKQGIEIVVEAARLLDHRKDLAFVVCGNGPNRAKLRESSVGLDNIHFHDLQPRERLSDLLGMASLHLLPQIAGAADLVLPSKLTNMLASGRPVVATALPGTGLAKEVEGCGLVTPPGDLPAFVQAIEALLDDPELRERTGKAARERALERWSRPAILSQFESQLRALTEPHAI
ncbi:WcaI family glycosyltransferase [Sphingomonas desiccabilis]|uniref:Colanic acid biosynthesis glycosyltransferase WcaI n=1 Tax=Sphingomonas desiccabilis TaxID=429134 RepID=A0A4Q2IVR9_9SPHN|nr:WcaI family glycosyltransferase [Sphingomonas desiccabilis]MBB3912701.1 colanic acid biosynthesis glycosyl transferase WcaI [Sphingomonas desiccabilis]RXZ34665.1 colanic acid biosynthesis glycosyltransferase WcaI [Sphingomonas desiccabilis]